MTYQEIEVMKLAQEKKLEQGRKNAQPFGKAEKVILYIGAGFIVFMAGRIIEAMARGSIL